MKKKTEDPKKAQEQLISREKSKDEKESKSKSQKEKVKKEETKEEESKKEKKDQNIKKQKKKEIKYNIDFIFRREQYSIKNQKINLTFGEMKKLISEELKIPDSELQIFYIEKEITSSKTKIYDLIKDNKIKFFEVKKIIKPNSEEGIISYSFIVKVNNIKDTFDFSKKIDAFFSDLCLEKNCISEPTSLTSYNVCFSRNDLAFDFNKYLNVLKKNYPLYENIEFKIDIPKQSKGPPLLDSNKNNNKNNKKFKNPSPEDYKKKLGNYYTFNDIQKIDFLEGKKKWLDQKGFINSAGPVKK